MKSTMNQNICSTGRAAATAAMLMLAAGASAQCDAASVYGAPFISQVGSLPNGVATGDLNNDGITDVVSANNFGYSASILIGNGDGTFQPRIDIDTYDPAELETIAALQAGIADFNGDGWNDIALGIQSGDLGNPGIGILLNDGAGNFSGYPTLYAFSTQLRDLEIFDMTGDGELDIIYANRNDNTINIVPGNGDGTFQTEIFYTVSGSNPGPVGVSVADYDNDGHLDIAAPLVFSSEVVILHGNSDGSLTEGARFAADSPEDLAVGDIDGDGFEDLATIYTNGSQAQYFLGNGDGTFGAKQTLVLPNGELSLSGVLGDSNNDGFDDLHVALFLSSAVRVFRSNGDGTFDAGTLFPAGDRLRDVKLGDIDGNGTNDVVTANGATGDNAGITVLLNACVDAEPCLADTNEDGMVSPADFSAWVAQFNSNGPLCDQNDDGMCTAADFSAWVGNYNAGCN